MDNERNLLGNRTWSAVAVRTAVVLVGLAVVLMITGAVSQTYGLAILGGIILGAGVIAGTFGALGSMRR